MRSGVHHSLLSAENALREQSARNPDGWGVAYYIGKSPHLIRSEGSALDDQLFEKVAAIASSNAVVAHVRRATQGSQSPMNSHPFQYGPWIFAHNGNIKDFQQHRAALFERIRPSLRHYILGTTDSEIFFHMFITHLMQQADPFDADLPPLAAADALLETIDEITSIVGPYNHDPNAAPTETFLTCIITNGEIMLAHQGGKPLVYSTYKSHCSERDICPYHSPNCEQRAAIGERVNHLICSSEPLQGQNQWTGMAPGQIIAVDKDMRLQNFGKHMFNAMMI